MRQLQFHETAPALVVGGYGHRTGLFIEIWVIAAAEPALRPAVTEFAEYVRRVTEFIWAPDVDDATARAETFVALLTTA